MDNDAQQLPDTLADLNLDDHPQDQAQVVASIQSKLDQAKGTSLASLPAEITEQIVAYAQVEVISSKGWPINEEHPLLKTMRLVSPAFNIVANQYLFNTVVLYEHPNRYEALNNIAKTPYLAPLVEYVQLANLGFLPDCSIQHGVPSIDWEEEAGEGQEEEEDEEEDEAKPFEGAADELQGDEGHADEGHADEGHADEGHEDEGHADEDYADDGQAEGEDQEEPHDCYMSEICGSPKFWRAITNHYNSIFQTIFSNPPAGGPLSSLDFSLEAIYNRYMTWRDGEFAMKAHIKNGTAPHLDLHLLPNLRNLEAVGLKEMRVIKRIGQYGAYLTTLPETRRFFETGLIEANALFRRRIATLTHLPTFMIAASACGKGLTSLTVHRVDELFQDQMHDYSNPAIELPNLLSLKIDLREVWFDYSSLTDPAALAPWMHSLANLEELHILQNSEAQYEQADVLSLLQGLQFPKLTTLDLGDGLFDFRVLASFLSKYEAKLSLVKINKPFMERDRWEEIRQRYGPGSRFAEGKIICLSEKVGDDDDE